MMMMAVARVTEYGCAFHNVFALAKKLALRRCCLQVCVVVLVILSRGSGARGRACDWKCACLEKGGAVRLEATLMAALSCASRVNWLEDCLENMFNSSKCKE